MAARKTHDVIASVGEYTDNQGQQKKRWVKCGSAFTQEDGRISIKLDSIPVGPEWSGWLSLTVPQDRDQGQGQGQGGTGQRSGGFGGGGGGFRPQSRPMPRQQMPSAPVEGAGSMGDDDIPFAAPHYLTVGGC